MNGGLATIEAVDRCSACGADVEGDEHTTCARGGGVIVQTHPHACAVSGCPVADGNRQLPSRNHHADHMHWHHMQWEKEAEAAPPAAPAPAAVPESPRVFDEWAPGEVEVRAGAHRRVEIGQNAFGAACVAVLAYCEGGLTEVVVECHAGAVPMGAYTAGPYGRSAVVKIAPEPGDQVLTIENTGAGPLAVRVGVRWELWPDA